MQLLLELIEYDVLLELNTMLIVLLEFAYIMIFFNFTVNSKNTLQFKQMMNLTVC